MLPSRVQGYIIDHNLQRVLHRYVSVTRFHDRYRRVGESTRKLFTRVMLRSADLTVFVSTL